MSTTDTTTATTAAGNGTAHLSLDERIEPEDLATRYLAMWNEPDPEVRRRTIHGLFAPEAEQIVDPPVEMRDRAREIGFEPKLELRGHRALERRVRRAYDEFVAPGTFVFRARDTGVRLRDVVRFSWEMVANATGEVAGGGLEVLVVDEHGRITTAYQFIDR